MKLSVYICALTVLVGSAFCQSCVENPPEMSASNFTGEMGSNQCVDLAFSESPPRRFQFTLEGNSLNCSESSVKLLNFEQNPIYDFCANNFTQGATFRLSVTFGQIRIRLDRGIASSMNVEVKWTDVTPEDPEPIETSTEQPTQPSIPIGETSDGCKIVQAPGEMFEYIKSADSEDTCIQYNFGMWDSIRRLIQFTFQPIELDCDEQDITLRNMYDEELVSMCDLDKTSSRYIYTYGYNIQFLGFRFERKEGTSMQVKNVKFLVDNEIAQPVTEPSIDYEPNPASCGRASIPMSQNGLRIINGNEATPFSHPWQVKVITTNGRSIGNCGGSLINNQWVLTAAHCLPHDKNKKMSVQLGAHDYTKTEEGKLSLPVEKIVGHEAYDNQTIDNDIALLKLPYPIEFTDHIQPICLPDVDPHPQNSIISGWGKTSDVDGSTSDVLMQVSSAINPRDVCDMFDIDEKQLCVGTQGPNGYQTSCQGDSGGPLTTERADGARVLNGVTSYGSAETCYGYSVYVNVFAYLDWIRDNMQ